MAVVRGLSVDEGGAKEGGVAADVVGALDGVTVVFDGVIVDGWGALEGVFVAEADGVDVEGAVDGAPTFSLSSPYSFHSSTSSTSCTDDFQQ